MLKVSARRLQIALGLLWLLNGLLQLQHQMFTKAFANQVIAPAAQGQPGFVSGPMHLGMHIFLSSPVLFNALAALTQLTIGALILCPKTIKLGLLLSLPWAVVVWIFGEGYGGIFSGRTSLLMGAPGAVSLYFIIALALMPKEDKPNKPKTRVAYWLAIVWLILWVGGGIYQLLPGQNSVAGLSSMIAGNADGAPHWLAKVDTKLAGSINGLGKSHTKIYSPAEIAGSMNMSGPQMSHMSSYKSDKVRIKSNSGYWFILILAGLQMVVGVGVLFKGVWRDLSLRLGILMSLVFWVIGQSLGGYYTGLATDLNSAPLFILMALCIWSSADLDKELRRLGTKLQVMATGSAK